VFFAREQRELAARDAQALLAHELVHVRQQTAKETGEQGFRASSDTEEQEALAVEAAVLTGGFPAGSRLRVDRFTRRYATIDGRPLTEQERDRLDQLSERALARSEELMAELLGRGGSQELLAVIADVGLSLGAWTDQEIVERWAQAIADSVRASLPR